MIDDQNAEKFLASEEKPFAKHHPVLKIVGPEIRKSEAVLIPSRLSIESLKLEDDIGSCAVDIYEWLGLVALQSPRIYQKDSVDPYLSRYCITQDRTNAEATQLITISWKAFVPSVWVRALLQTTR